MHHGKHVNYADLEDKHSLADNTISPSILPTTIIPDIVMVDHPINQPLLQNSPSHLKLTNRDYMTNKYSNFIYDIAGQGYNDM